MIFGWIATACFALCYVPQIIKTYRTKKVRDVSLDQWLIQLVGYITGLIYGIELHQTPLIFGYIWGGVSTIVYIALCIKLKRRSK